MAGLLMLAAGTEALAHRMPGSLSTIRRNPVTGTVEIIHRLHTHDAEIGVMATMQDRSITLDDLEGRARLALYVDERFLLAEWTGDAVGAPLDVELVGAELDGEFVLVYQQLHGELPPALAVQDGILRDVFPDQVNQVNIATHGEVRSLTFQGDDKWRVARLD